MTTIKFLTGSFDPEAYLETISGVELPKLIEKENLKWFNAISITFQLESNDQRIFDWYNTWKSSNAVSDGKFLYFNLTVKQILDDCYSSFNKVIILVARQQILNIVREFLPSIKFPDIEI